jgi:ABC-type siderophore export system fused ATPase/permease subunit
MKTMINKMNNFINQIQIFRNIHLIYKNVILTEVIESHYWIIKILTNKMVLKCDKSNLKMVVQVSRLYLRKTQLAQVNIQY